MNIIRSNLEVLLAYAIAKREKEEHDENPKGQLRSGHLEAWKAYLKAAQAGEDIRVVE